jgi:hypothetical protein
MTVGDDKMLVNENIKEIDPGRGTAPVIIDGRTMVPIRAIVEEMGGTAGWDEGTRKVSVEVGEYSVAMCLDSKDIIVNGESRLMDIAPTVTNDRTVLPIRFVAENVDCQIEWIGSTQQIIIVFNKINVTPQSQSDTVVATDADNI